MNERERLIRTIKDRLSIYATRVDMDKGEASRAAEDFYCGLLNILKRWDLQNMNRIQANYPAIDLGGRDEDGTLGIQVTSTATREKVQHTLDTLFRHGKEREFEHVAMLVIGKWTESKKKFRMNGTVRFDPERDIWDTDWLVREIEHITELDHLRRILAYLEENLNIAEKKELLLSLLPRSSLDADTFVGRGEELARIAADFEDGKKVVFLSGLGGIGKTELAVQYARRYISRAYQVTFVESFARTLRENVAPKLPGFTAEGKDEAQIEAEAMEELAQCDLLILDNADHANLTVLTRDLKVLPMQVLVTTRVSDQNAIRVRRMENGVLYRLFVRHGVSLTAAQMDDLIAAVDGHTMTVDMIARTLADPCCVVSPEDVCSAMTGGMDEEDYTEIENDHDEEQRKIYGHLRALFQLQGLTEAEEQTLRCAVLLPGDGMALEVFRNALNREEKQVIPGLVRRGWLQCEEKLLTIHPVIRLVCRTELKPTEENCEEFLDGIRGQYDRKQYDHEKFRQMAEVFETASNLLEDKTGFWAGEAGYFWDEVAETQRALECNLRSVKKMEQHQPDSDSLATGYNNVGYTYGALGDHEKALEYDLKALVIRERVLPPDHPDLAQSYNNVGSTYGALGDHGKALEYDLKALAIRERVLPPDHPDLAQSYNNVSVTYGALGDYEKELEYDLKALAIREQVLPLEHPDLALSYDNVGVTYGDLGDYEKDLEYKLKALAIFERVLPPDHPDLATNYSNVSYTYGELGDHDKELEYNLKALAIRERVLPGNHPHLAMSFNNIAWTYYALGRIREAANHMRRAADIINRSSLPENHPDRANYNKWAEEMEAEARQEESI